MSAIAALPFGKFAGAPLADVPTSYLKWAVDGVTWKNPKFKEAIVEELQRRAGDADEASAPTTRRAVATARKPEAVCDRCGLGASGTNPLMTMHRACAGEVQDDVPF